MWPPKIVWPLTSSNPKPFDVNIFASILQNLDGEDRPPPLRPEFRRPCIASDSKIYGLNGLSSTLTNRYNQRSNDLRANQGSKTRIRHVTDYQGRRNLGGHKGPLPLPRPLSPRHHQFLAPIYWAWSSNDLLNSASGTSKSYTFRRSW